MWLLLLFLNQNIDFELTSLNSFPVSTIGYPYYSSHSDGSSSSSSSASSSDSAQKVIVGSVADVVSARSRSSSLILSSPPASHSHSPHAAPLIPSPASSSSAAVSSAQTVNPQTPLYRPLSTVSQDRGPSRRHSISVVPSVSDVVLSQYPTDISLNIPSDQTLPHQPLMRKLFRRQLKRLKRTNPNEEFEHLDFLRETATRDDAS